MAFEGDDLKKSNVKGSVILLLGSLIWGLAFVVQTNAADKIKPFAFNSLRSFLGAFAVFVFLVIRNKINREQDIYKKCSRKDFYIGGTLCGVFLCLSCNLQQWGITVYPSGVPSEARAGFITALYVVLVPILAIFIKKKTSIIVWLAVVIAFCGIYLLCVNDGISGLYLGDVLMFLCALACAVHILIVDKYCDIIGGTRLAITQFIVCGILSGILSLVFEPDMTMENVKNVLPQILYMGIMSSGVAYTLQIVGQKYAEPAVASISMSFESVFATLGGWLIVGNGLSFRETVGCILVFFAIISAQLPEFINTKPKKEKKV